MKWPVITSIISMVFLVPAILPGADEFKRHGGLHSFKETDKHVARFEAPDRVEWQKPDEVLLALDIREGDHVADIGAGSGFFTRRFAKAVGPGGSATGFDVEPGMVRYMKNDAQKRDLKNYHADLISAASPALGKDRFDIIFMCNTYHHITGRPGYLRKIYPSLKQGGRIVIVDYRKNSKFGPPAHYKLEEKTVIREFGAAGYRLSRKHDFLPNQYMLEFVRKAVP